jgi:hypothetical protein
MATPVVEQAKKLAHDMGVKELTPEVIEVYSRILARTSLVVPLGPTRAAVRGKVEDERQYPDATDYAFFKEMLEKTAISEFFEHQAWGTHRVLMDMHVLENGNNVPAYRVFWNERYDFLRSYNQSDDFKSIVEPMIASISMLLGVDWASWVLDVGQEVRQQTS